MELSADYSRQTICAVATAFGAAGIAVVRVSGADAIRVVDSLFRGKHPLCEVPTHTAHYGTIGSPVFDGSGQNVLDEVVCTVFRAPHSFTGEDTVEISCHGSLFVQQELVRLLIDAGARMADKGEFTKRAFLNGRIDLAQAEAVADLIAASSAAEKDVALSQLRGGVSGKIAELREQLLTFTSLLELELDFADHEELEFADRSQLTALLNSAAQTISSLIATFQAGNAIKQGVQVAIVGAPNAGKSTLLNALLGDERAIVSDIRGTTRDTIEDTIIIGGVLVRLTDTAGIQSTEDVIEQKGIERSRQAIRKAHIVIELLDSTDPQPVLSADDLNPRQVLLRVLNKVDLQSSNPQILKSSNLIYISAKLGDIHPLLSRLESEVARLTAHTDSVLISNARHYEALCRAQTAIERVSEGLQAALSGELLALDLHDALDALGEITGEVSSQEVLNTIFERFCIGK
ncbi:MAG: tRNA uridine-5-carboxymethylaminomethyl(34) synthesis GTPase MnmE [Paludibacteraceae bacterium]|nr:tRNA uridine-5-carboxymethylaminomethyl(34) synthesis GTPase MnmE [Paludibacteraceae bacterium]